VEELNRQIEAILREAGLIPSRHGRFYPGMPVLITRNDYQLNLFNGEIGILLPDPADGSQEQPLWAWFPGEAGIPRRILPARLPDHEPAYAMTVHKSQGSEFDRVLMLLPDRDMPLITRELIYTGLTRAKTEVDLWFEKSVFEAGVARRTERVSGLRDALVAGG
jgi:exodeoxyribonuclease V alpha subunit